MLVFFAGVRQEILESLINVEKSAHTHFCRVLRGRLLRWAHMANVTLFMLV